MDTQRVTVKRVQGGLSGLSPDAATQAHLATALPLPLASVVATFGGVVPMVLAAECIVAMSLDRKRAGESIGVTLGAMSLLNNKDTPAPLAGAAAIAAGGFLAVVIKESITGPRKPSSRSPYTPRRGRTTVPYSPKRK